MPRLNELFEAGAAPGCEPSAEQQHLVEMMDAAGPVATSEHLLGQVHQVYRLQGVRIDDRHFEIVLQQMLNRLRVTDPGDTLLDPGQVVSRGQLESANAAASGAPAVSEPAIVGVSQAAASTEDFIAAAASYGGIPTLARAAACGQRTQLTTTRHAAAFCKLGPTTG